MKTDISVNRTLTISVGNYESIKPSISLTLKDIEVSKVSDAYVAMSNVLSGLMKIEILECSKEFDNIKKVGGISKYTATVADNLETIGKSIEDNLSELL